VNLISSYKYFLIQAFVLRSIFVASHSVHLKNINCPDWKQHKQASENAIH